MTGKVKKPTSKQLRPIALKNVSYKLYMSFIGKHVDRYVTNNDEIKHTQVDFPKDHR